MDILASGFSNDVTAWSTAAAAVGTVGTLVFLVIQLASERRRRQGRERRAQAEKVSGWITSDWMHHRQDGKQTIALHNESSEPVYQAVIHLVFVQGGPATGRDMDKDMPGFRQAVLVIPPGRHFLTMNELFHHMHRRHGVELAFTDRSGVHWLRDAKGRLNEINQAAPDFYGLGLPVDWGSVEERNSPDEPGNARNES
jgi:hypothetical protein